MKVQGLVTQLCPTLCDLMDYSPLGSVVHGILQARILEWVAVPFTKGSSPPRSPALQSLYMWATREADYQNDDVLLKRQKK